MLSTFNIGRANDNNGERKHFEYLGNGGIMEFKSSNHPHKKLIDCVDNSETGCADVWTFAELYSDNMPIDFFDYTQDLEIYDYKDVLKWCTSVLEQSPSARVMLGEAIEKDWMITLEDLRGGDYCLDVENKILVLDNNALVPSALIRSTYFRNITLVTLTKALRDIWQEKRHGGFDEDYAPAHVLLMERIRAADLDVIALLVGWELRSENSPEVWRHMIGSEIGDMAMAFSGHLERDPSAQFNGHGLLAAFKQWFREAARVNRCDHDTLEYLDEVLATSDLINPFGQKTPGKMHIEILSCLPDKTAYLQGQGAEMLSDPMYSSVDDDINQTHLFHIMHDLEAVVVENVPFRDPDLARKIFPVDTE
tara:strand:+ start:11063 stop:12157 length:1095 start_codon:yes stop_codon:yes gene_type:complete